MKQVRLIHNPNAGDGENSMLRLVALMKREGYECCVSSTEADKNGDSDIDYVVIAGGDGTVRHAALEWLHARKPFAVIPRGTANNISKALSIKGTDEDIISHWNSAPVVGFDLGVIDRLEEEEYFLEGIGFGVFPALIREHEGKAANTPTESLESAMEMLHRIINAYQAHQCEITIDNESFSGKFLMIEIMNTNSVGPNLVFDSSANPGDGLFEVVMVKESQRENLANYILHLINGTGEEASENLFTIVKGKKISVMWEGEHLHVDDKAITLNEPRALRINVAPAAMSFVAGVSYAG